MASKRFIEDEAAHSGQEEGDEHDESVQAENEADRNFIDDSAAEPDNIRSLTHYFPSAPAPIYPRPADPVIDIDEEPRPIPPVAPNPPPPPTAKEPPKKDEIRPKDKKPKELGQKLQAHLLPAVFVGHLTHNLVTILPVIKRKPEDAWKAVPTERAFIVDVIRRLPDLFGALICMETHGSSRPKKKDDPTKEPPKKRKKTPDENDPPLTEEETKILDSLAGKPHYHVLLYYRRSNFPQLDLSFFKREIMANIGNSDVNEKRLPEQDRNPSSHYVRAFQYCLKGVRCKVTAAFWKKYAVSEDPPPMPEFIPGPLFGYDVDSLSVTTEEGRRMVKLLDVCKKWVTTSLPLETGDAPGAFERPIKRSAAEQAMIIFAEIFAQQGIVIAGKNFNKFYSLATRPDYQPVRTYVECYRSFDEMTRHLSANKFARSIILQYRDKIPHWLPFADFKHLPVHDWDWIELSDSFYHIRTGTFRKKDLPEPFHHICFRAYGYSQADLEGSIDPLHPLYPIEWLALFQFMCTPKLVQTTLLPDANGVMQEHNHYSPGVDAMELKLDLARLLRKRVPKQAVPFLHGASNSGKTTLISFVRQLYPTTAIGFLNNSVCGLSGIHENIPLLYCDEFKTSLISREDLLLLFDGSQPLSVRQMHQDARLIDNPMMPIIMASNFKPKYDKDDSKALENRVHMYYFTNVLVRDDKIARKIEESHLFVVHHLNHYLKTNMLT